MQIIVKYFGNQFLLGLFSCLFLVIYFNNETLPNNLCILVSQPCVYVVLGILVFYIITQRKYKSNIVGTSQPLYLFMLIICILLNGIMDTAFSNGYFLIMMNVIVAYFLSKMIRFRDFALWYVNIIFFLCICSLLITYPLASVIRTSSFPHLVNSAGVPFVNAYLCFLVDVDFYFRNTGIFREAGVWGFFIVLAAVLTIENSFLFKPRWYIIKVIVFVTTILSTFSTASLMAITLVFIIMIFRRNNTKSRTSKIWLIIGAVLVLIMTLKLETGARALNESVDKLSGTSSLTYRTEVIKNSVPIILNSPLGCGIVRGTQMLTHHNSLEDYHNTSTFVACAVYFGWIYIILYTFALFLLCRRRMNSWLYFIPLCILMNSEQYIFNPIVYLLVFYGLQRKEQLNLVPLNNR